jgi:hypothetical protein
LANDQPGDKAAAELAEQLEDGCRAVLARHPPALQGAALAALVATWLAGHRPEVRDKMLELHVDGVRNLVPHYDPWPPGGQLHG